MKNNRFRFVVVILSSIIIISVFPILLRDPIFMDSQERRSPDVLFSSYSTTGSYKFNPISVLETIKHKDSDIFTTNNDKIKKNLYENPFHWTQSDYLDIANAVHQFAWKETLVGWNLHDMSFSGQCEYDPFGFDMSKISFYKLTGLQEYSAHMIGIYPLAGAGEWGGGSGFNRSVFSKWNYIDLEKLSVTAEDAFEVAENNGGKQARLSIENRCRINLLLSSYPYPRWQVSYSQNISAKQIFEIAIDAYSGRFDIVSQ